MENYTSWVKKTCVPLIGLDRCKSETESFNSNAINNIMETYQLSGSALLRRWDRDKRKLSRWSKQTKTVDRESPAVVSVNSLRFALRMARFSTLYGNERDDIF